MPAGVHRRSVRSADSARRRQKGGCATVPIGEPRGLRRRFHQRGDGRAARVGDWRASGTCRTRPPAAAGGGVQRGRGERTCGFI